LRSVLAGEPFRSLAQGSLVTPRIGYCRTVHWSQADATTRAALDAVARGLADAGAEVIEYALPVDGVELSQAQVTIMSAEAAQSYGMEYREHRDQLSPPLRALVESGGALAPAVVAEARALADRARGALTQRFATLDAILTPAAPGEAPKGLERTGDPVFNRAWTLLGGPCVTIPIGRGPNGLPLGAQLVGAFGRDRRLLEIGAWTAARVGQQIPVCIL
jgi:Asp-tRNA(Asn)/Glu-tRNA(Gln) amidotransferase A subunit family amidase